MSSEVERLAQRSAHRRDALELGRRQVVEVLVHRIAGMDLVRDAVEARHEECREAQIGIGGRIREAHFDALGLGVGRVRDAARGRAVARRIGEQHRRLIARHQALVGVGRRVGEGVAGLGMLDHAADEIEAELGEIGILIAGHLRLAVLPDREVAMHARAVVAEDRLRHEGGRLAIGMRHIVDHIFIDLHLVGHGDQRVEFHAELVLGGGHFVMVLLDGDAHLAPSPRASRSACPGPNPAG